MFSFILINFLFFERFVPRSRPAPEGHSLSHTNSVQSRSVRVREVFQSNGNVINLDRTSGQTNFDVLDTPATRLSSTSAAWLFPKEQQMSHCEKVIVAFTLIPAKSLRDRPLLPRR